MRINILTLFPQMFTGPLSESILKRAVEQEKVHFNIVNIRDFTDDRHHTTDQPPYGGGPGMVMMVEQIDKALSSLPHPSEKKKTILLSAKGKLFTQALAHEYAQLDELTLIC